MTPARMAARLRQASVALLALLAYLPTLTAKPGVMPADTKLYLYTNPGRLISDAPFTWDTRQFAGWVPHQTIAYLWPQGPWYWLMDKLGAPDWVAQRLWLGTLLFVAALGVLWAARLLGLSRSGALCAAVVYQLSPYILPYVSRTSAMLLPWASVGWLVGLTIKAARATEHRWRHPALIGLVLLSVGAVNATALGMIAPAPVLWLVHAAWQRSITWRQAALTALRIGVLGLGVSLWWIAMLSIQGRYGADVLAYSESLQAVSLTSTSVETLRGLGYWLLYVRDPYAFTTTAANDYMSSGKVLAVGFVLLVVCLAGLALTRWRHRRFAGMLLLVGIVLGVGVHPIGDPSPLMSPLAHASRSTLSLAMRSSTRALPISNFALALGAGALVTAVVRTLSGSMRRLRWGALAPILVIALAVLNLPALFGGKLIDPALARDENPPAAWMQAADHLSSTSSEYRVLQLPGSEFGAFRWGYTVDPPLPGLTSKPLVTRDLLPLGSSGAMDLLYALDDQMQLRVIDPASIAPVARFLGVDTVWVPNDIAFDRFRTPRPEIVAAMYAAQPAGLGAPVAFGTPQTNVPVISMVDETALVDAASIGTPLVPVELVPVQNAVPIVRASSRVVVLAGSGEGVVDASAAGLLHGDEALFYAADLHGTDATKLAPAYVILTDTNRDQAHQWRGSQDVTGFTESGGAGGDVLVRDEADQRLPVFGTTSADTQTVATLDAGSTSPLVVRASGYGEPFAYRPEDRPAMAVDGDPGTAWVVGDRANPVGQYITVSQTNGTLDLLQPQGTDANRMITAVDISAPGSPVVHVALSESSLTKPGQRVNVPSGVAVRITIAAVGPRPGGTDTGPSAVGFAELGLGTHTETVRLPQDAFTDVAPGTPVVVVLTRQRTDPLNRWRSDPEPAMQREFTLPSATDLQATVTLRMDARAADDVLATLERSRGDTTANRRLTGDPNSRGIFATDANPATAWTSPFNGAVGSQLRVPLNPGTPVTSLQMQQRTDAQHSTITGVSVAIGGASVEVTVPPPDANGVSTLTLPSAMQGPAMTLTVTTIAAGVTIDRRYAEPTQLPVSIRELTSPAIAHLAEADTPISSCDDSRVTVDGTPLPLAITASVLADLSAGKAVDVTTCDGKPVPLAAGTHHISTANGLATGIDVDRIVLRDPRIDTTTPAAAAPTVQVARGRTSRSVEVSACPQGCWLIMGEGFDKGWTARITGNGAMSLGAPQQIAGGFNGWWLPPSTAATHVDINFRPQRTLDIALVLSALAVLVCVALAIGRRRGAPALATEQTLPVSSAALTPAFAGEPLAPTGWRDSALVAALIVVVTALVASPATALLALPVAIAVAVLRRPQIATWAAVALAAVIGAGVVERQVSRRYPANGGWPALFDHFHRPGMLVVVLLVMPILIGREHRSTP